MIKKILFASVGLLIFNCLYAQRIDSLPSDPDAFISELEAYMTSGKRAVMEEAFEAFEDEWKSGVFTAPEVAQILKTTNRMLEQKLTASPYFLEYLKTLAIIKNAADGETRFKKWHGMVDTMLVSIEGRKLNPFIRFLEFSYWFFSENRLRHSDIGVDWIAVAPRFEWVFEDGMPKVRYDELQLICTRKEDSITIENTAGIFLPTEGIWKGKGGKVTWERFGFDSSLYVQLGAYEIEVKKSLYRTDEATLHYPQYFGREVIAGSFEDKVMVGNKQTSGSYPRFESDEQILKIDKIGEGVEYIGGFRMHGTTVYGFGHKDKPAQITVTNAGGERSFRGLAELFVIRRGEQIVAEQVESTVYFGKDSLYHPAVSIRFNIPKKILQISRGDRASERNPFYSSMHEVNISADDIVCYFKSDSVLIGQKTVSVGAREKEVEFESLKYFQERDYRRMQNIASYNPIAIIKIVAEKEGTHILDANFLARRLDPNFSVENIQSLLYDLVARGFIKYDSDKQEVEVKDKVFHYADASQNKVDYDALRINSKTEETNAVLDLASKKMNISGVSSVEFSEKQKVGMLPFDDELILKENRNIDFDGKLFAGFTTLLGHGFHFDYDKFQIDLDSVRYFDIYVPTGAVDKKGNMVAYAVGSRLEHLTGVLLIDAPSNKAGREDIVIFPSLQSKQKSFVFYDATDIQQGVYNRDSFYFHLDPFSFNSLDRFGPQDVKFEGTMISANILPDFEETLVLMPVDSSLGFTTNTPADGYPAYLGKGKYTGQIGLSNQGFLGKGRLDYLGAQVNSEDIVFKPSELLCTAERFDLEEDRTSQVEVPQVRGLDVTIQWKPYRDSMYVNSKEAPFELFKAGEHQLAGTLILSPGGLKGNGVFEWSKASMTSDLFNFGAFSTTADTASVAIRAFNTDEFALSTDNLNAQVDFDKQIGVFVANDEFLETILPYNQYKTNMNEFTWDMKEETVTFKTYEGKLGTFTSIHPDQDSLTFNGKTAFYDLKSNELKIGGVPVINSCDALIYPETGDIEIHPGGVMSTLENARIVADTTNKYHVINRATVDIGGKKYYTASGYYEYKIGKKEQEIFFEDIVGQRVGKGKRSDKATETRAKGQVLPEDQFYIDLKTEFRGEIALAASSKNLNFDGFARLDSETLPNRQWFSINSEGDKKDLKIAYDEPRNYDGAKLYTGLFLSRETARMYPRVMHPLYFRKDREILPVKGLFKYDLAKDRFIFSDSTKMINSTLKGNQLIFNNRDASIEMEGTFNIGSELKHLKITAVGEATSGFELTTDSLAAPAIATPVKANFLAGIDLIIPERFLKMIVNDIKSSSFDAAAINYVRNRDFYRKGLAELIPEGTKDYNDAIAGLNLAAFDLPKKYNKYSVFFSHLPMKWDADYQSFVSVGDKLGLYSLNGDIVDKMLTAYVEFKMPASGEDRLYIYIKSPSDYYYFIGYKDGILNLTSNNTAFNEEVIMMKKKEAVIEMENDEIYEIAPVEQGTAQMFVRRIQAAQQN